MNQIYIWQEHDQVKENQTEIKLGYSSQIQALEKERDDQLQELGYYRQKLLGHCWTVDMVKFIYWDLKVSKKRHKFLANHDYLSTLCPRVSVYNLLGLRTREGKPEILIMYSEHNVVAKADYNFFTKGIPSKMKQFMKANLILKIYLLSYHNFYNFKVIK